MLCSLAEMFLRRASACRREEQEWRERTEALQQDLDLFLQELRKNLEHRLEKMNDFTDDWQQFRDEYEPRFQSFAEKLRQLSLTLPKSKDNSVVVQMRDALLCAWLDIPSADSDVIDPEFFWCIKNIRFECEAQIANFKADLEKLKNGELSEQEWLDLSSGHDKSFAELSGQLQRLRNEMQAASPEKPHPYFSQVEVCLNYVSGAQVFLQDEVLRALNCKLSTNSSLDPAGKF